MHVRATGERGWPRGWQTLTRAENVLMPHPPGLARWANASQLPGGGRGARMHLELTDALFEDVF